MLQQWLFVLFFLKWMLPSAGDVCQALLEVVLPTLEPYLTLTLGCSGVEDTNGEEATRVSFIRQQKLFEECGKIRAVDKNKK